MGSKHRKSANGLRVSGRGPCLVPAGGATRQDPARLSVECKLSRVSGGQERKQGRVGSQSHVLLVMPVVMLARQVGQTQGRQVHQRQGAQHHQHWACLP